MFVGEHFLTLAACDSSCKKLGPQCSLLRFGCTAWEMSPLEFWACGHRTLVQALALKLLILFILFYSILIYLNVYLLLVVISRINLL